MASKAIVTDLDHLISLGFVPYQAKMALKTTKGSRPEAVQLLRRLATASSSGDESSWRGITDEDWMTGSDAAYLPRDAETRALMKSPIYAFVASYRKCYEKKDEVFYAIRVSLKDKRSWEVERSYQDFLNFYFKLPIPVHTSFTCRFPAPKLFHREGYIERRLTKLQEWLRELTLNESCMTNTAVLPLLYTFLKVHENGGPATAEIIQNQILVKSHFLPSNAYHFLTNTKMTPASDASDPLSLVAFQSLLPIKYDVTKVLGNNAVPQDPFLSQDLTQHQLMKDYNRDRIIVNGKRVLGCSCPLETLIDTCHQAIQQALAEKPHISPLSWDPDELNNYITSCLRSVARTESAFLSHAILSRAIDLVPNPEQMLLLVPESTLAAPIEVVFSIREKSDDSHPPSPHTRRASAMMIPSPSNMMMPSYAPPPLPSSSSSDMYYTAPAINHSAAYANEELEQAKAEVLDWCIMFQAQASMVFRVCSADTLEPKLQVQTVFRKVIYGMPKQYAGNPDVTFLDSKPSSAMVYVDRELRTSTRDWG